VHLEARAGTGADEGSRTAELGLISMQHVVLVHDHPGKPRRAQRNMEVLGQIRENGAEPVFWDPPLPIDLRKMRFAANPIKKKRLTWYSRYIIGLIQSGQPLNLGNPSTLISFRILSDILGCFLTKGLQNFEVSKPPYESGSRTFFSNTSSRIWSLMTCIASLWSLCETTAIKTRLRFRFFFQPKRNGIYTPPQTIARFTFGTPLFTGSWSWKLKPIKTFK
jgi:hypothetical protein